MALTTTPEAELGKAMPSFSLSAVDGKNFRSSEIPKNTPVAIMFICNHCPYVKAIEDRLIQLGTDLRERKIPLIAICSNDSENYPEDSLENLRKRAQEKHYPFVYLHDESQEIAKTFGAVCTPDFFVYDKEQKLAYRGRLDDNWKEPAKVTRRELFDAVVKLSQGQKLTGPQPPSMGCSIKWK